MSYLTNPYRYVVADESFTIYNADAESFQMINANGSDYYGSQVLTETAGVGGNLKQLKIFCSKEGSPAGTIRCSLFNEAGAVRLNANTDIATTSYSGVTELTFDFDESEEMAENDVIALYQQTGTSWSSGTSVTVMTSPTGDNDNTRAKMSNNPTAGWNIIGGGYKNNNITITWT